MVSSLVLIPWRRQSLVKVEDEQRIPPFETHASAPRIREPHNEIRDFTSTPVEAMPHQINKQNQAVVGYWRGGPLNLTENALAETNR